MGFNARSVSHTWGFVVAESQELKDREERSLHREGLEILYLKPDPKNQLTHVAERDLTSELREKYWIRAAQDKDTDRESWVSFAITIPWEMERHELGRNRNEPGDGFRYVYRSGSAGTGGRVEWFEVTEVFEGVEAKDIEAFMRIENGGEAGFNFDPSEFVNGLNMGIPSRTSQQRAAGKVIDAVERKLNKASYEGMWREHGYGTLIVGLPLWFAMPAANPLRVENVVDNFGTRMVMGLKPHLRRLRKKSCPFWRIVVVWCMSPKSMRDWCHKAKFEIYDDPAYQSMGSLPLLSGTVMPLLSEMMDQREDTGPDTKRFPDSTLSVCAVRPKKKGKENHILLPPAVEEWKRRVEENGKRSCENLPKRLKLYAVVRFLEVFCFIRLHGVAGLERWLIAKLSPRRQIARFALGRRARRLYRASMRGRSVSGRHCSDGKTNGGKARRQRTARAKAWRV